MKSKKIWIIGFVILGCLLFGINYYNTYQRAKKNAEELNVKIMYDDQNQPFAVDCDLADMDYYHGSNELNLQKLAVYLYTYSLDKPENQVTIRDIQVFLSSEQAEDGTLMVYSCPDSLDKYIEWWWHSGSWKNKYLCVS